MKCTPSPSVSLTLSFIFSFFSLALGDWGASCNLSVGFSPFCMDTCSIISVSFSIQIYFAPIPLLCHSSGSPLLSSLLSDPSLGWVSCPHYLRVWSMYVTGQLCRKEGRLMTTEICSDSGPVQTVPMGSMCFLASVECQRTPVQHLSPPLETHATHSGKGSTL